MDQDPPPKRSEESSLSRCSLRTALDWFLFALTLLSTVAVLGFSFLSATGTAPFWFIASVGNICWIVFFTLNTSAWTFALSSATIFALLASLAAIYVNTT